MSNNQARKEFLLKVCHIPQPSAIFRLSSKSNLNPLFMKSHLFTLLLLFFSIQIFAQDGQPDGKKHEDSGAIAQIVDYYSDTLASFHDEVGLNFTRFLDEALDFGGSKTVLNPYLFTYRRVTQKGDGFRLGVGLDFGRSKGNITSNSFDDNAKSSSSTFDIRLGSEHQRRLSRRWVYYYGFDGLLGYSALNIKSSNAKITNSNMYGGFGPVIGAQLMLTDRVGIFTEASFYLIQSFLNEKTDFTSGFEDDEKNKSNSTNLSFKIPTNIYLFFRF